jgi:hypothetical protein
MTHLLETRKNVCGHRFDAREACFIISCDEKGHETRDERMRVGGGSEGIGRKMSRRISICDTPRIQSERARNKRGGSQDGN